MYGFAVETTADVSVVIAIGLVLLSSLPIFFFFICIGARLRWLKGFAVSIIIDAVGVGII
jgi:hypothetical protein